MKEMNAMIATPPSPTRAASRAPPLTSAFQPIVRASDGEIVGHHALPRDFDQDAQAIAPWPVLAQAAEDAIRVRLDRLTRTVHALNYFHGGDASRGLLYLNVEQRLPSAVTDDHGESLELILEHLDVPASRVAIVLPSDSRDDPVSFVRTAIAYRIRGYRVVAQLRGDEDRELEHVFLAEPHDVALDAPQAHPGDRARRIVEAASRRGIHAIARRIEDEAKARSAREMGFGFLQGWHFAGPGAPPAPSDSGFSPPDHP
jgi:EAL domain-containing protein (putative c-di-GMP-specific phosphodiesterase class I)